MEILRHSTRSGNYHLNICAGSRATRYFYNVGQGEASLLASLSSGLVSVKQHEDTRATRGEIPEGNEEKSGHRSGNNSCLATYGRFYFARMPSLFGQGLSQRTVRKYCSVSLRGCDTRVLISVWPRMDFSTSRLAFYRATVPKQCREKLSINGHKRGGP